MIIWFENKATGVFTTKLGYFARMEEAQRKKSMVVEFGLEA